MQNSPVGKELALILFDTPMVFLKEIDFEKKSADVKKACKIAQ